MLIKQIGENSIRVGVADEQQGSHEWHEFVAALVQWACVGQSICLLSYYTEPDSLARALGTPSLIRLNKDTYGVNRIPACSLDQADFIARHWNFSLTSAVVAFIHPHQSGSLPLVQIFDAVNAVDEALVHQFKASLLYMCNDGYWLEWLRFDQSMSDTVAQIQQLSQVHGLH